ncbi:MAG: DUF4830 domain-containing protein [Clostridia bacterium]|nr:DUF4830 domain-containing protein [Clostridia bacterium]
MKFFCFYITNKKLLCVFLIVVLLFVILVEFLSCESGAGVIPGADNNSRINFIKSLGVTVSEEVFEQKEITIPQQFNKVYENYNNTQIKAGFNLKNHLGKNAVLYRYVVNSPKELNNAFVNIIVLDGEIIGGDISSVELDGYMLPLVEYGKN